MRYLPLLLSVALGLAGICAIESCSTAFAAAPSASLTWSAPTEYTDGTPISSPITYNIYRATTSGAETLLTSAVTVTSYVDSAVAPGTTYYYEVTAVVNGEESAKSSEGSKAFGPLVPSAPLSLSVQ